MRIFEIASAEEQMALWKLISGSVWTAIEQQVQQQQRERAAQAKHAAKGKSKRKRVAVPAAITLPPPPQRSAAQPQSANAAAVNPVQTAANVATNGARSTSSAAAVGGDVADIADVDIDAADLQQQKSRHMSPKTGVWPSKSS